MGELIRVLSELSINNAKFKVELNHPPATGLSQQIHIQSELFRAEFDKEEFVRFAAAIRLAAEKLRYSKKLK